MLCMVLFVGDVIGREPIARVGRGGSLDVLRKMALPACTPMTDTELCEESWATLCTASQQCGQGCVVTGGVLPGVGAYIAGAKSGFCSFDCRKPAEARCPTTLERQTHVSCRAAQDEASCVTIEDTQMLQVPYACNDIVGLTVTPSN